jgi:hypothetical protein
MPRSILVVLAWAILMASGFAVDADDPPSLAEQAKAALDKHRTLSYALPGYPPFQTADGQKLLELTDEQKSTIRDIGLVFNGKVLDQRAALYAEERKSQDLTGEEKEKFLQAFWAKEPDRLAERRAWAIAARRQVEQVLTEKQLKLLRETEFAQRTQYLIYQPQMFAELQLDEKQQAAVNDARAAFEKRRQEIMAQLLQEQTEASVKLLEMLTPEKREQLRELLEKAHEGMIQVR